MLEVRAFQWVIYDQTVTDSIRPLRWSDLEDLVKKGWLKADDLDITLPASWPDWVMNINDLDSAVPAGLIPAAWNGKTSGQITKILADPNLRKLLDKAGVLEHFEDWLNWKTWSIDQLQAQLEKGEVKRKLEGNANLDKFNALIGEGGKLDQLSQNPSSNWDIRKLDPLPAHVHVNFSGKQTRSYSSFGRQEGNRYYVSLKDLKESVRLSLYAEDFFAPSKDIELVPPPEFSKLEVYLEEPAYKYYHLKKGPQTPLKGEKQVSVGTLSVSGQITQFDVLKGTNVKLVATAERELKEGIQIESPPSSRQKFKNSDKPVGPAVLDARNKKVFSLEIPSVQQTYEFELHYVDEYNVRGSRHIIIKVFEDEAPEEAVKLALTFPLRLPTVIQSEEEGAQQVSGLKGYLITPDAKIPLKGMMKDDIGIANMEWEFEYEVIDFNLSDYLFKSHKLKEELEEQKLAKMALKARLDALRRAQLLAVGFHGTPLYPSQQLLGPLHLPMLSGKLIELSESKSIKGEVAPMLSFHTKLTGLENKMWEAADLKKHLRDNKGVAATFFSLLPGAAKDAATKKLTPPRQPLPTSWRIEDEDGFDVQQWVGDYLKPKTKNSPQQHFKLLLRVKATDNNLETGPGTAFSKEPIIFIVISATELQILIRQQENQISEALQEVKNRLDKEVRNIMGEQIGKIKTDQNQDLSLVRIRIEKDVLPFVIKTSDVVSKALTDYKKIYDEMLINRLDKSFSNHVKFKIIYPLEDLIEKKGDMERALAEVQKLHAKLKEQEAAYKGKSIADVKDIHLANLNKSQAELNNVVNALHEIIEAIGGGIPKDKLIHELEVIIELRKQHDATLAVLHKEEEERLLKLLQGLGEPERPDPKKEIKKQ
jgi:hypothetical protein